VGSSTGKGRLYRIRQYSNLRGRVGLPDVESAARVVANDTFWGGYPPTPTQIPYSWLTPPARFRSDQPRNVAQVTRTGGGTARAVSAASVDAVGERPFSATLDTQVVADPASLADWIVANYTSPRQRMPQLRLNLLSRTPTECWRILEREIGDRISITGAPGEVAVLNANPYFETDASDWFSIQNAGLAWDAAVAHEGAAALLVTPDGVTSDPGARTSGYPVRPGLTYTYSAWVRVSAGGSAARSVGINWRTADDTNLSADVQTQTPSPTIWTFYSGTATAPPGAAFARLVTTGPAVLAAANTWRVDEAVLTGPDASRSPWPDGVTELVIEGIAHSVAVDTRWVVWNTAPVIGATPGEAGPWFRADESRTDTGSDLLAF
jgi:hypothetical protein